MSPPPVARIDLDLAKADPPKGTGWAVSGLGGLEGWGRWAEGPQLTVQFAVPAAQRVEFKYSYQSPIAGQRTQVSLDGGAVATHVANTPQNFSRLFQRDLSAGQHRLVFATDRWNHLSPQATFAPQDGRLLSLGVVQLSLSSYDPPTGWLGRSGASLATAAGLGLVATLLLARLLRLPGH